MSKCWSNNTDPDAVELSREVPFLRIGQELLKKSHNSKAWSLLQMNHLKDLNKFYSSVDQVYFVQIPQAQLLIEVPRPKFFPCMSISRCHKEVDFIVDQNLELISKPCGCLYNAVLSQKEE